MTRTVLWRLVLAAICLVLLNASLSFENVWPTPKIRWANAVSIELAACVLVLVAAHRWAPALVRRVGPALWVVLIAGHYLDVTAPGLYGREFNVYWDSQHLGNVAAMLARAAPVWLIVAVAVGVVLMLAVGFAIARLALRQLAAAVSLRGPRLALGTTAAALLAVFTAQQLWPAAGLPVTFADPVTPVYLRQARFALGMFGPSRMVPTLGPSPAFEGSLAGLRGADVLLVFVESYGAVTFETESIAEGLRASRADLAAAAEETGREIVSAYVESPTFGGSSWLAHLSLISGVEVRDQYAYTALMASRRDTAITNFSRRGYRTVALMPGMRQQWPEGAFYQFDQIYGRDLLEYTGPQFGWWSIPDQYALAKLDELERTPGPRAPLFVVFPTSTTHAPFGPVAPYQPDWSRVLTAEAFDPSDVERAMAVRPDLTNLGPSYVQAMAYEYMAMAGYLRQHPADDMVFIAVGDHQPPAAVSGPDAPWHVPVHVIARRGPLLDRLEEGGFGTGIAPRRPSIGSMHALLPLFLRAFDAPPPQGLRAQLDGLNGSRLPPIASARRPPSTGGP